MTRYDKMNQYLFSAAQDDLWIGDRQAFVKCAADPKPDGSQGGRGGGRGGRGGGRGRGRGNDRQSFGGGGNFKILLKYYFIIIFKERRERNDEATMFVKNLPWSATKDSVSELFGDVKVSQLI